jgi:hypothetical protein
MESAGRLLAVVLVLAGCGGARSDVQTVDGSGPRTDTSGDEAMQDLLPPPDPARSTSVVLDEPYRYVIRSDVSQVRGTPLEPEIRRLLEAIPQWRAVLEVSDLDPINDIDSIVAGAPGRGSKEYVMLARHNSTVEEVKQLVVDIARSQGHTVEWGEHQGIPAADWPGEPEVEQSVALPRDNWLVLGPSAEVARLIALSRTDGCELVPGFPMPWDDGSVVDEGAGLMGSGRGIMGGEEERPHYPDRFKVRIWGDENGDVTARWEGSFDDPDDAAEAREYWDSRRQEYANNPMLSLLGLSSAIEDAEFEADGGELHLQISLTQLQMSRLVRFATPVLVGGRRGDRDRDTEGEGSGPTTE